MAGLSAAAHLSNNGVRNIAVLEGAARTGGRIHTVQFGRTQKDIVELGANWIHGPALTNSISTLANEAGLLKEWRPLDRCNMPTCMGILCEYEFRRVLFQNERLLLHVARQSNRQEVFGYFVEQVPGLGAGRSSLLRPSTQV